MGRQVLCVVLLSTGLTIRDTRAQVLTTAETIGSGTQALMLTENHLWVDGVELNIPYVQWVRGLHDRFDLYASVGATHIFDRDQAWIGVGGNLKLFHRGGTAVSLFNIVSTGLHRREESSTVLLNSAVVVSRKISNAVSVWSGVNALIPIGARDRGVFTPPTKKVNVPVGVGIFHGPWGLFMEVDIGRLKAVGFGLARTF